MRLSFAEHSEYISADMDKSINAMAQIITKSQSKPMGSRLTFCLQPHLRLEITWYYIISKNEIISIFHFCYGFNYYLKYLN